MSVVLIATWVAEPGHEAAADAHRTSSAQVRAPVEGEARDLLARRERAFDAPLGD
jgi:hypothetical protein